jgi:hypothetical protein
MSDLFMLPVILGYLCLMFAAEMLPLLVIITVAATSIGLLVSAVTRQSVAKGALVGAGAGLAISAWTVVGTVAYVLCSI